MNTESNGASLEKEARWVDTGRVDQAMVDRLLRRSSAGPGERETMDVVAPFTGHILARVPSGTPEDMKEAVRRARLAQEEWARTPIESRAKILLRFHDMILDRQDEILDLVQLENGKARFSAFEEVADVAITSRYYAINTGIHLSPKKRRGAVPGLTVAWEFRHPRGVVGFIAPWNYPLTLAISDAVPALMAGNAVIIKPDSQTPLTALWAADLLYEAGLPPGLIQIVTGGGSILATPMIESVDFIGFTGSTKTGRLIAAEAGKNLIGCSLELGGKNPLVILADADVERAAQGAVRGCFSNSGQLCISFERILVSSELYDRFVDRFVSATRAMRLGSALDYGVDMGSIASRKQFDTLRAHIEDAVEKGATILAGGRPRPELGPLFHEPTILAGVRAGMKVHEEETFGPLVSVYTFESDDEAISMANASAYGLNASIWSRDVERARSLATRIQAGSVNINDGYHAAWASLDAPMGGFKNSGIGRRHGAEGILKYTEAQTIAEQPRMIPLAPPKGMQQATFTRIVSGALRMWRRVPFLR